VLAGSNETNGTFDIDNGTVVVEGTFFAGGFFFDPVFNVNAGGTLAGSGSVRGSVAVTDGGTIAPGASAGTLATKDLTLDAGAVHDYELAAPGTVGSGVNDRIDSDGNVVLDGTLNISDVGGFGPGTYRLIDYTGSLIDDGLEIGSAPAGLSYTVDTSTAGQVDLVVSGSNAGILVLPERIGFGEVESGTSSAPAPVLVTSDGIDPLMVGSVQLAGSGATAFGVSEDLCTGQTLPAGADCDIAVTFSATGIGLRLAWLEIPSNAANLPARVPLIGYAVTADNLFTNSFE
jgi:fibronectin-binding autotransporter adhesin